MRLALKINLLLVLMYLATISALIWWSHHSLQQNADSLMEQTAQLVGSEIAVIFDREFIDQFLEGTSESEDQLLATILRLSRNSQTIQGITVVDREGEVVVSDSPVSPDYPLDSAAELFGTDPRPVMVRVPAGRLQEPGYLLKVPLPDNGRIVGYVQMSMATEEIQRLFAQSRNQLLWVAIAGLVVIGILGLALHLVLRRRAQLLLESLEGALTGSPPQPSKARQDEFAAALDVAGQVGQALVSARRSSAVAGQRLERLAHLMDVGVVLFDGEREPEMVSGRALELLGLEGEPTLPRDWERRLPQLAEVVDRAIAFSQQGPQDLEMEVPTARGTVHRLRAQGFLFDDGDDGGVLVLLRDRGVLDSLEDDLRSVIRLQGLTRLYMGIAHDLKAPLNALGLNLELLKRSLGQPPPNVEGFGDETLSEVEALEAKRRRWVEVIESELARLGRSLELLLGQVAPASDRVERFDMGVLVGELEALLSPQADQQRVALTVDRPDSPVMIEGRKDHIKQAILSVALNALEAMEEKSAAPSPPAGAPPEAAPQNLTLALCNGNGKAQLQVADTGPGIPPNLRERIFDLQFTTKASGSGLGLYMARSIIAAHGGVLDLAESSPEGTTFRIDFPVAPERPDRGAEDTV